MNQGTSCALAASTARLSLGDHEQVAAEDHVAVAVAVGGGAEIGRVRAVHRGDQLGGIDRVRIGMPAAEIGQRLGVDRGAGGAPSSRSRISRA